MPLNENSGEDVHDSYGEIMGSVKNPVWLINKSYYWKNEFKYHSSSPTGVNFDDIGQIFYIFNKDSLIKYDIYYHKETSFKVPYTEELYLGMNFLTIMGGEKSIHTNFQQKKH